MNNLRLALLCLAAGAGLAACTTEQVATAPKRSGSASQEKGYYKIVQPYVIDGVTYTPAEDWNYDETGIASWYGPNFHGKRTANGEMYNMNEVTAAHKTLPMPSLVRVTNLDNGRSIIVRLNDRGPYARGRILDMSRRGAQLLGYEKVGTAKVRVQILARESQALAAAARNGILAVDLPAIDPNAPPPPVPANRPAAAPSRLAAAPTVTPLPPPMPSAKPPIAIPLTDERRALAQSGVGDSVKGKDVRGRFLPAPDVTVQTVSHSSIFIQAGAFSVVENAERLRTQLNRVAKTDISPALVNGRTFYRVRIGPLASVEEADQMLTRIVAAGGGDPKIIVD